MGMKDDQSNAPESLDADIARLYREAQDEQPPAALDTALLQAAREAVRPPAAHPARWQVPLSVAAVLALAVLLVPLMHRGTQPEPPVPASDLIEIEQAGERRARRQSAPAPEQSVARRPAEAPASLLKESARLMDGQSVLQGLPTFAAPPGESLKAAKKAPPSAADSARSDAVPAPDPWLERITVLLEKGERERALEALRDFRKRFPDYPLPPALAAIDPAPPPAAR